MNFPQPFLTMLAQALPQQEINALLDSFELPPPSSIRLNTKHPIKLNDTVEADKITFANDAYSLKTRPAYFADPAFHAGEYYVQEASSMVIGTTVKQLLGDLNKEAIVLDLCAAPGGKSTHIASVLNPNDILVANETIHSRTPILQENLCKWGAMNHLVTRADAKILGNCAALFDIIVADMPCSGEGMFRKDPKAALEWSEKNVTICTQRQQRIVADIWPSLAEEGYFIYSTCTYNIHENEENIHWICKEFGAELVPIRFAESENFYQNNAAMYRLLPHRNGGEGFFFAVLKKTKGAAYKEPRKLPTLQYSEKYNGHFTQTMSVFEWQKSIYFIQQNNKNKLNILLHSLPLVYSPGTPMGSHYDKGFKPDISLALAAGFDTHSYPAIQISDKEIIAYLRRETLANNHKQTGLHIVMWNGIPFGFVNGLKHQWNNMWPMDWRLRKEGVISQSILQFS